ncbi:MAG: response regulator transcription factor [Proteobacteria bacterium]|nr:response regulator transcription factor [Pseudomonadota bacterium]MBU4259374.1 response regulator transcription factor [Pseudomonadota bacterium]MBU4287768.1 response regulator transcription factor [Pseudomonadota bacterium]MBU4415112.1 response regulator transcription factor [Pseudomonadota bacterium]MCG2759575.1 response regulator transcription factor [Desulfobacteraceae bacterium]
MKKKIRVLIADDHAMVRDGLCRVLEDTDDITVVGQADNGLTALSLAKKTEPDVAVLDYTMPKLDGLVATQRILALLPKTKVLILTVHDNIQFAIRILEAGAHGFLLKEEAADQLITAIRDVNAGKIPISPTILEKLTARLRRGSKDKVELDSLSTREFELLRHIGAGKSIRESASCMCISESTASTYRSRLLEKLGLKTTGDLIRFALEKGIVS